MTTIVCTHCGGTVDPQADHTDGMQQVGDAWVCSDICAKIVTGTHWPTPVGPATHDEIEGWIAAEAAERRQYEEFIAAARLAAERERP